jgi:hypothetical protein
MKNYKEYEVTITMNIMGKEVTVTFKISHLEEEYTADEIFNIAAECIYDSIELVSYSIKEME